METTYGTDCISHLEIDTAARLFPVAKAGGFRTVASSDLLRLFHGGRFRLFPPFCGFGQSALCSRQEVFAPILFNLL